jgi:hypothetical protein
VIVDDEDPTYREDVTDAMTHLAGMVDVLADNQEIVHMLVMTAGMHKILIMAGRERR